MFLSNLTTIVGVGEILLIAYHLFLTVTEIDSKSITINQITTMISEEGTMEDNFDSGVVIMNNNIITKGFLKITPRRKRNFVNMVRKCCKFGLNTTTSTCTPFFIRRTKMTHRKTTRLKKPNSFHSIQPDFSIESEPFSQQQNKTKFRKLFFPKHSSTSSFVKNNSDLLTSENKKSIKTTNSLDSKETLSEKATTMNTARFNVNENINGYGLLSTNYSLTTTKDKVDLSNSGTTASYFITKPFTSELVIESDLTTLENLNEESTLGKTYLNSTISSLNISESVSNITHKRFHLKSIFHFTTPLPLKSVSSDRIPTTFESGHTLPVHNIAVAPYLKNSSNSQFSSTNNIFTTSMPNKTFKFKKLFHIHKKLKIFPSNVSTEKYEEFDSTISVLKQTTDGFESQIPSSSSTVNIEEMQEKDNFPCAESSTTTSPESDRKYKHFRHMLHRERKTTLDKIMVSSKPESGGTSTLKINNADSNFKSEASIAQESKTETLVRQENEDHTTYLISFKKENSKGSQSVTEFTTIKDEKVLNQNNKESTAILKVISGDKLSNNEEYGDKTTPLSPFKIKYLMRFRNPISTTKSSFNETSELCLPSGKTRNREKEYLSSNEPAPFMKTTTESTDIQNNLRRSSDSRNFTRLGYDSTNSYKKCNGLITKSFENGFSARGKNHTSSIKYESNESTQSILENKETKRPLKFKDMIGSKKYKLHGKNVNHKTAKPGRWVFPKQDCRSKPSTKELFNERFNITVYSDNSGRFRDWFVKKSTTPTKNKGYKSEENMFRWCFEPTFNNSRSLTKPTLCKNCTMNITMSTLEMFTLNGQIHTSTASSFLTDKKFKNFFHFKTTKIPLSNYNTTIVSIPDSDVKELKIPTTIKLIQLIRRTLKYDIGDQAKYTNFYSEKTVSGKKITPIPFGQTSVKSSAKDHHQSEIVPLKSGLNSTDKIKPNISTKVYMHGKVKHFFYKLHTTKVHSLNTTYILENSLNNSLQKANSTEMSDPQQAIGSKLEIRKLRKHFNKTILHNASDVNDTSFNIVAYVMKPLDSLVSVFRAHSPNNVTKIGDVNATDLKNRSLSDHLHPPNSSIVILAVNSTNTISKDIHETKLDMALDLLGGLYHCVFNNFFEARLEDIHFYLYTRSSAGEPEELIFKAETLEDNVTTNYSDFPEPVFEKGMTSESPLEKREVEDDEDDDEYYEFEPINPAKSEIESKWFNVRAETKVIIHGYLQDYQTDIIVSMREAYLSRGSYNVVVMDWSVLVSDSSCYPEVASRGLRQVGGILAQLLNRLVEAGVSPSNIHIVGFSLGAHVAGHAGSFLSQGLVSRITGLDPALPYVPMEADVSLNFEDAAFVDIIHSAAGLLGQSGPMGHVDFYPNGGSQQPGCDKSSMSCSHRRAALYFIESINSDRGFQATKCESWRHFQAGNCSHSSTVLMGDPCPTNSSGKYYLVTSYKSPFAILTEDNVNIKKSSFLDLFYDFEYL